ncbi:riboflavin synthase [bacterium]|nr:riboflavin synthase [bacterium]
MFTGIIREIGVLRGISPRGEVLRLAIAAPRTAAAVRDGDSVAVDGICLTVTGSRPGVFSVEAAAETRRLTTLGAWQAGRRLHLEPALRAGDGLDGHYVQGHVDGTGRVTAVRQARGGGRLVTVAVPSALRTYLTPKGSVALDGVSLTVDEGPFADRFTVNLIPHTLAVTNLGALTVGAAVNLEMDVLVKAVRGAGRPARAQGPALPPGAPLTLERLRALGFGAARRKDRT